MVTLIQLFVNPTAHNHQSMAIILHDNAKLLVITTVLNKITQKDVLKLVL